MGMLFCSFLFRCGSVSENLPIIAVFVAVGKRWDMVFLVHHMSIGFSIFVLFLFHVRSGDFYLTLKLLFFAFQPFK